MLFGYSEAEQVKGRFYEFRYKTVIKRTEKSRDFVCFRDNDLQVFEHESSIFMFSEKDFLHIVDSWRDIYGIYSYIPLGFAEHRKSYTASEVVALNYERHKFKYLLNFMTVGSIDYIH